MVCKPETNLTRNETLVFDVLQKAEGPMSAYTILDELREDGFRAPLQVYRAVEKLREKGVVHRLESLNAFVACKHPDCKTHETPVFMICDTCKQVEEISATRLFSVLERLAERNDFQAKNSAIELRGECGSCQ